MQSYLQDDRKAYWVTALLIVNLVACWIRLCALFRHPSISELSKALIMGNRYRERHGPKIPARFESFDGEHGRTPDR